MSPSLLDPISLDAFSRNYDGQRPLHVERSDASHFAGLFAPHDIETLLDTCDLHFPDAQLSRHADPIASADYTDASQRIVAPRFLQHHADGATIVLSQAHRFWPALRAFCANAQTLLGRRCQTNLYLTPPDEQGFGPHYDAHDVFILQVSGAKRFRFHAGGPELPLAHQRFDAATCKPGPAGEEVLLRAGDTLYIPRGVMHDALADGDAPSLHITLGVFGTSWLDLAIDALQRAAQDDLAWRAWVPGQPANRRAPALVASLRKLLAGALPDSAIEAAGHALSDALSTAAPLSVAGSMARLDTGRHLTLEDRIRTRLDQDLIAERRGDTLVVRAPGTVVTLGGASARAVERLLAVDNLTVSAFGNAPASARNPAAGMTGVVAIEQLAPAASLALARQLLRQGIIERVTPCAEVPGPMA